MITDRVYIAVALCLAFLVVTALHFLMEPARWAIYTGAAKTNKVRSLVDVFLATSLASYLMPFKLGVPIRFLLLEKYQHLGAQSIVVIMALDQVISLLVWTIACVLLGRQLIPWLHFNNARDWPIEMVFVLLIAIALVLVFVFFSRKWPRLVANIKQSRRVHFSLGKMGGGAILLGVDVLGYIVRHILILRLIGVENLAIMLIAGVAVISIFAGMLSGMPMGLGGYDGTVVLLLVGAGVSIELAILVPTINRLGNLLVAVALGFSSMRRLGVLGWIKNLKRAS